MVDGEKQSVSPLLSSCRNSNCSRTTEWHSQNRSQKDSIHFQLFLSLLCPKSSWTITTAYIYTYKHTYSSSFPFAEDDDAGGIGSPQGGGYRRATALEARTKNPDSKKEESSKTRLTFSSPLLLVSLRLSILLVFIALSPVFGIGKKRGKNWRSFKKEKKEESKRKKPCYLYPPKWKYTKNSIKIIQSIEYSIKRNNTASFKGVWGDVKLFLIFSVYE